MSIDKGKQVTMLGKTFENTEDGLIVRLKIIPNSSRNEIILDEDILKIKLTAQPIENKANKSLIEFISQNLRTAKSNIKIIKGELNKEKTLLIKDLSEDIFKEKFNL